MSLPSNRSSRPARGVARRPNGSSSSSAVARRRQLLARELVKKYAKDIRGPNSHSDGVISDLVNPSLPINVSATPNAFMGPILSVVSLAIERGWTLSAPESSYIYWAAVYQTQLIIQVAQGGVPLTQNVPKWLHYILQAVIKTTVKRGNGSVSYQFNIPSTLDDSAEQNMGPVLYGRKYFLGGKTPGVINSVLPVYNAPSAYTEENGRLATQNLWLFLEGLFPNDPMHKMVESSGGNKMTRDASAFAWSEPEPGGAYFATGGWFKNVWSEVTITAPTFSVFSIEPGLSQEFVNRSKPCQMNFSGDSVALGGLLASKFKPGMLRIKQPPKYKFVDFLEYANVFCFAIQEAIKLRVSESDFVESATNDPNFFDEHLKCPLTLQEFLIMFRAAVMTVHQDQHIGQALYPNHVSSNTTNAFISYLCGVNTAPIPITNQMLMPMELQINILANASRAVTYKTRSGAKSTEMKIPILGQYALDRLNCEDYVVSYNIGEEEFKDCIFTQTPGEVTVNLVDGSTGSEFVGINDPTAIMSYVEVFNNWIQDMANYFRNLTSVATDSGLVPAYCGGVTTHWQTQISRTESRGNITTGKKKKVTLKKKRGKASKQKGESEDEEPEYEDFVTGRDRFRKRMGLEETTVYSQRALIAYTLSEAPFESVWTLLQQYFVTPVNNTDFDFGVGLPSENTGVYRMGGYLKEVLQINTALGDFNATTMEKRHRSFASLMIKRKFAMGTTQQETLLDSLAAGESGILGQLVSNLAGSVAHTGVDVAAEMLGQAIPI